MSHPNASLAPTQRRISVLRHAKAVPDDGGDDHARSLTAFGRDAALELGQWLKDNHTLPELILCSTAVRTRETLAALQLTVPTILSDRVYLATAGELLTLLQEMDSAVQHVMIVGHNPGIHGLAAMLARDYVREADADAMAHRFPTCGLVSMTVEAAAWTQLAPHSAVVDLLRFSSGD